MARVWIVCAALLGAVGVSIGAYRAHGLEKQLVAAGLSEDELQEQLSNCETGVRYQMYHTLALLAVGLIAMRHSSLFLSAAAVLFLMGIIGFSGGLYAVVFARSSFHLVIPIGGLMLILGWIALAVAGFAVKRQS